MGLHTQVRDKVRNKTKVNDIIEKIKEAKWRWAGHIAKRTNNGWAQRLTNWQPRQGRDGGEDKNADGVMILLHMWTRLGQD